MRGRRAKRDIKERSDTVQRGHNGNKRDMMTAIEGGMTSVSTRTACPFALPQTGGMLRKRAMHKSKREATKEVSTADVLAADQESL